MNLPDFIRKSKIYFLILTWFALLFTYSYKSWDWYRQYILFKSENIRPQIEYGMLAILIFIIYLILSKCLYKYRNNKHSLLVILTLMIGSCIVIAGSQSMSTDIYMNNLYGRLLSQYHQSPYFHYPSEHLEEPFLIYSVWRDYTSPYPPLLNYLHAGISYFINNSVNQLFLAYRVFMMTSMAMLFTIGTFLIKIKKISYKSFILLVLNPLIIIETMGNVHTETIVSTLLLWFIYLCYRKKKDLSILLLGLLFNIKYTLIVFITPIARFVLQKIKIKSIIVIIITAGLTLLSFLPLVPGLNISVIFNKIFEQANQVNISIPYTIDTILQIKNIYNRIPILSSERLYLGFNIVFLLISIIISIRKIKNPKDLVIRIFWNYYIYIVIFASWIQPWYGIPLIALGLAVNAKKYKTLAMVLTLGYLMFYSLNLYSKNNFTINSNLSNGFRLFFVSLLPLICTILIFRKELLLAIKRTITYRFN